VCCRYGVGQKYGAHFDSLVEQSPRIATVLIYLQVQEAFVFHATISIYEHALNAACAAISFSAYF
jgi:hypothetical protein